MKSLDPHQSFQMPAHFGPRQFHPKASGLYRDVTALTVSYLTDPELLAGYLPEPFGLAEEPLVSVVYARNREVDWLAGHGYNLIAVNAAAVYRGTNEELVGTYSLVMWENSADAILSGRELQGIPKLYADIADHTVIDGRWETGASHFGHRIVDLGVSELRPATETEVADATAALQDRDHPMAWRYFPGISGFGTSVSEPTTYPSENTIERVDVGSGAITWHPLTWEQNPTQFHIANALGALPVLEMRPAVVTTGSTNLIVADRLPRTLD